MNEVHVADTINELRERTSFLNHAVLCMSSCVASGLVATEEELTGLWRSMYDVEVLIRKLQEHYNTV